MGWTIKPAALAPPLRLRTREGYRTIGETVKGGPPSFGEAAGHCDGGEGPAPRGTEQAQGKHALTLES